MGFHVCYILSIPHSLGLLGHITLFVLLITFVNFWNYYSSDHLIALFLSY